MKPTRRLEQQPQSLADYCAQHPQDVAAPSDEAGQVWRRFRDTPAYKALLQALCEAQQGLCIYCEQRVAKESGTPVPLDHRNKLGVPHANLDATINQVLNLNCERLRVARQPVLYRYALPAIETGAGTKNSV